MPKVKTRRGAAKRFSFTSRGKIRRKKAYLRHILTHKSTSQKRKLRKQGLVSTSDRAAVRRLLPYG